MNGPDLFEQMYSEDSEGQKLNEMPGIEDLLIGYPLYKHFVSMVMLISLTNRKSVSV